MVGCLVAETVVVVKQGYKSIVVYKDVLVNVKKHVNALNTDTDMMRLRERRLEDIKKQNGNEKERHRDNQDNHVLS